MLEGEAVGAVQEDEIEVCVDSEDVCGKHACDDITGKWDGVKSLF